MSALMEEEIKRGTARRKSAPVLEIIQGKKTISEESRQFDLSQEAYAQTLASSDTLTPDSESTRY